MDLVRLAIPRRVYTQSHIDYVVEVILEVWKKRDQIHGLRSPTRRHSCATSRRSWNRWRQWLRLFEELLTRMNAD